MIRRLKALHIANAALEAAEPDLGVHLPNCPGCNQAVWVGSPQAIFDDRGPWHAWCLVKSRAAAARG